jgi:hypothetical protein
LSVLATHAFSPRRERNRGEKLRRRGSSLKSKENKTPGGEHYLDPPGDELLAWF